MKDFLLYLCKSLVKYPEDVVVSEKTLEDGTLEFTLHVHQEDMGRIIGRNGKTARALRLLVSARGSLEDKKTLVEIADEPDKSMP